MLSFPVSALLGVSFLLLVWLLHSQAGKTMPVRVLSGWKAGAVTMSAVAVMMAIEGTFGIDLHHSIPFLLLVLALQLCLELAVLEKLSGNAPSRSKVRFIATHLGMLLMVWASFWGAADVVKARLVLTYEDDVSLASDEAGMAVPLPFSLKLESFRVDTYDHGTSPRQFTSGISVRDILSGKESYIETSVNHPASYGGYRLYQSGYDPQEGRYSVIQVVRDPWIPAVWAGMLLLMIGSALMLSGRWKLRVLIPAVAVLAVVFTVATIAKISFGTLPPALRSIWFVPHVIVYMVAYSAMALSLLLAIAGITGWSKASLASEVSDSLMRTSSVLLLFGMLCGCVWAKQAWGDYWTWDPKECWAGVTWLMTLVHIHLAPVRQKRPGLLLAVLLLTFLSIQVTWYGVNYLPSSSGSMHTYNM